MEQAFILIVAGLTSVGTYVFGVKGLRLSRYGLWLALGRTFECVGLTLIFSVLNLMAGMGAILGARFFLQGFVSLYMASDATLLVLSLLQALTFQAWRQGSRHRQTSES